MGGFSASSLEQWLAGNASNLAGITGAALGGLPYKTSSTSTPILNPDQSALEASLLGNSTNLLNTDPDLSGYLANGLQAINTSGQAQDLALKNTLASRGLATSPVAATALTQGNNARIAQGTQLTNSIPLLAQQLMMQKLQTAGGVLKDTPFGTQTNTTSNQPGGPLGALLAALGSKGGKNLLSSIPGLGNQNGGNSGDIFYPQVDQQTIDAPEPVESPISDTLTDTDVNWNWDTGGDGNPIEANDTLGGFNPYGGIDFGYGQNGLNTPWDGMSGGYTPSGSWGSADGSGDSGSYSGGADYGGISGSEDDGGE